MELTATGDDALIESSVQGQSPDVRALITSARDETYWAFTHYSRPIRRGARRIEPSGNIAGVSHVAFANPDGEKVVVLTNASRENRRVLLRVAGMESEISLDADSISTLTWRAQQEANRSDNQYSAQHEGKQTPGFTYCRLLSKSSPKSRLSTGS